MTEELVSGPSPAPLVVPAAPHNSQPCRQADPVEVSPSRPRVLVCVRYFLPGDQSGGPVRSVANIVAHLGPEFDFVVLCLDRDVKSSAPYSVPSRPLPMAVGAQDIIYLRPLDLLPWRLLRLIRVINPAVVYCNSLFDPTFTLVPLLAVRLGLLGTAACIISPRGELAPAALALKASKKRAFVALAARTRLYRSVLWAVSSQAELADLRRRLPTTDLGSITIAGEFPSLRSATPAPGRKEPGTLRLVLIARVSRMKNILQAIRLVSRVPARMEFDIWGPNEDSAYWRECAAQIALCPPQVVVRYRGPLPHCDVPATLVQYHVFFMPTLGENFGHSIVEALACGLPAVISDRTPWRNLAPEGAGADIPLTDEPEFIRTLARYAAMDTEAYGEERRKVLAYTTRWIRAQPYPQAARALLQRAVQRARYVGPPGRGP